MKNKIKIFSLLIALNMAAFSAEVDSYNSELVVRGDGVRERVDYTLYSKELTTDKEKEQNMILNGTDNGKKNVTHAAYVDKGATLHNIGKILSYDESLQTHLGGLVIMGIVNPLKRDDTLIALRGESKDPEKRTTFINDGLVKMGSMYHDIRVGNVLGVIPTDIYYAQYTKNIIDAKDADIVNNGTISNNRDKIDYLKALDVGVLNGFAVNYEKNAVNIEGGRLKNTGTIEYNRDEKFNIVNGVAVDLLQIGVDYNREKSAVKSNNSYIENSGTLFVGGDVLTKGKYSGIGVGALGADLRGEHNKYGINATGRVAVNTGVIEVERDFKKALDDNNNILDLYLIYHNILKLGLLSFTNLYETSIGVHINNGKFYNNGGTISVGVNDSKKFVTQLRKGAAIAVSGNKSKIFFNIPVKDEDKPDENKPKDNKELESTINLEGKNVYAVWLENDSHARFEGTTEINFIVPEGLDEEAVQKYLDERNRHIFYTDGSSDVTIAGEVIANGDISISQYEDGHEDIINIESGYEEKRDSNGNLIGFEKKKVALTSTGKIELGTDIKVNFNNFIGMKDKELKEYATNEYVKADGGIVGDGTLVSGSYLFDVKVDKTNNSITLTDVDRKDFNTIVENKELAQVLEDSYEGVSGERLDFYKYIALGKDQNQFSDRLNEITGIDNITTLETQVMDITKDLNRQYRNFIKSNKEEGIVFSYLNSKSNIDKDGKYDGFDRKSNGIMTGYNKKISDNQNIGLGFSYMKSDIDYTSNSTNKIETWNGRIYSDHTYKNLNMLNEFSFGYNKSENKRYINGNLNDGDINVYTLGLNNSLYKDYKVGDKLYVTPSINLDLTYYYQDEYKESGKEFLVNAEKTDEIYATLGAGIDFKYDILKTNNSKLSLINNFEYYYDILNNNGDEIELRNIITKFSEEKREMDKDSLSYSIGLNYEYNDLYNVQVKYSKEMINDVDNEKVGVDFSYKF